MTDNSIPTGDASPRSTDELARVEQALRFRLGYRVHDLHLGVEPHGLVLTGRASSYYDKQLAQQLVKALSELSVAENRITVDLPSAGSDRESSERFRHHRTLRRQGGLPHSEQRQQASIARTYFYAQ